MSEDSKLVWLVVLIIVVIVVAVLLFRSYYKTEQERQDNMNKLYLGIGVGIVAVILGYYLMDRGDDGQEYGLKSWWYKKKEENAIKGRNRLEADRKSKAQIREMKANKRQDEATGRAIREGLRKSGSGSN
jgi:transposase